MLRKEVRKGGELSKIGADKGAAACYSLRPATVTQQHGELFNVQGLAGG